MTISKLLLLAGASLLLLTATRAQDKLPVKFGKVTPEDFNVAVTDSSAGAIVIADYGTSEFETNPRGWFDLVFKHSRRIKILNRSGFDAATVTIPLYKEGTDVEKLMGLRASTYTLENGKVVETKLEDKAVFTDQLTRNWLEKKFTFPALKEGAIVEYTYTQSSPFLTNLQPWSFQSQYPCLWSEYEVDMPNFFQYVTIGHGYLPINMTTPETRSQSFRLTIPGGAESDDHYTFDDQVVTRRWVMKNVPALKEEPFTTTMENYMAKVEFQLARYSFTSFNYYKDIMGNWFKLSEALLLDNDFGADLDRNNGWLDDDCKTLLQGANDSLEKARRIFGFVRDKFNCTSHSRLLMDGPLKDVYRNRHGSEAELNLLLIAMLRHEKLNADPVILSTRSNGFPNEVYPLLSRFNYVICRLTIGGANYYLDASEPWLGFGMLPERCYNGYARVLNKDLPAAVSLDADSMKENTQILVILNNDEKGGITGTIRTTPGFNEACEVREKLHSSNKDEYLKKIQSAYTGEYSADNLEIDSLQRPDDPLQVSYDVKIMPDSGSDLFYFNPMLGEGYKENPFKSADRRYPVEMPYTLDEIYTLNMEIPKGYVVDELPKQARVTFNDNEGFFEYLLVKSDEDIQFRSRIKLNKANFKPEDYATLRDFFGFIVKKQNEQIVFKKKKSV